MTGCPPYNRTGELHPVAIESCSILKFAADRRPSQRLPVAVADDEAGVGLFSGPGRREAARGRHEGKIIASAAGRTGG
jgi:hypothetical protein